MLPTCFVGKIITLGGDEARPLRLVAQQLERSSVCGYSYNLTVQLQFDQHYSGKHKTPCEGAADLVPVCNWNRVCK